MDLQVLNGLTVGDRDVPVDATLGWLRAQRSWDWFDAVHLHHVEFEPVRQLRAALVELQRAGKRVVFTAHDVDPVFSCRADHHGRFRVLAAHGVPFVCLTPGTERAVQRRPVDTTLLPHGYVAPPGAARPVVSREPGPTRFLIYGSLRANRDVELVLACWRFARDLRETELRLLLRAPSRSSLAEDASVWQAVRDHAADPRLKVDVLPYPTDRDVDEAVAHADCLVLPYRWATHSGQLEHGFDLGVLTVATRVGFLPEQVQMHHGLVDEPIWCDWSPDAPYEHGARLLDAMIEAHRLVQQGWETHSGDTFASYRAREHRAVIAGYRVLYGADR